MIIAVSFNFVALRFISFRISARRNFRGSSFNVAAAEVGLALAIVSLFARATCIVDEAAIMMWLMGTRSKRLRVLK